MTLGFVSLVAANAILLLLIGLGLVAIVLSDQAERRTVVIVTAIGGLLSLILLTCCGVLAGLAWYLTTRVPLAPLVATPIPRALVVPTSIPLPSIPPASISLSPNSATIAQGESISITIQLANATALYGVEVHLTHGDGLSAEGLAPGTCASDFIARSQTADGRIDFAAVRTPQHSPVTGDCEVATFTLTGKTPGTYTIAFDTVILASNEGVALPVETTGDGTITVVAANR